MAWHGKSLVLPVTSRSRTTQKWFRNQVCCLPHLLLICYIRTICTSVHLFICTICTSVVWALAQGLRVMCKALSCHHEQCWGRRALHNLVLWLPGLGAVVCRHHLLPRAQSWCLTGLSSVCWCYELVVTCLKLPVFCHKVCPDAACVPGTSQARVLQQ
jgi:hypothetical protein